MKELRKENIVYFGILMLSSGLGILFIFDFFTSLLPHDKETILQLIIYHQSVITYSIGFLLFGGLIVIMIGTYFFHKCDECIKH